MLACAHMPLVPRFGRYMEKHFFRCARRHWAECNVYIFVDQGTNRTKIVNMLRYYWFYDKVFELFMLGDKCPQLDENVVFETRIGFRRVTESYIYINDRQFVFDFGSRQCAGSIFCVYLDTLFYVCVERLSMKFENDTRPARARVEYINISISCIICTCSTNALSNIFHVYNNRYMGWIFSKCTYTFFDATSPLGVLIIYVKSFVKTPFEHTNTHPRRRCIYTKPNITQRAQERSLRLVFLAIIM